MRGRKPAIGPDREATFIADWHKGTLSRVMADRFECSITCVKLTAHRLGLPARKPGARVNADWKFDDLLLHGGAWVPNGRGTLVWEAAA